jgi:hypothetical protein
LIEFRLVLVTLAAAGLLAAGCGGDDEDGENGDEAPAVAVPGEEEAASLQQEITDLNDEEQIERVGEAWAEPFAAGDETMCGYLHPDLGAASSCSVYVQGALTGSSKLQGSFAGTTVENVELTGETAVADFSNGEAVTFRQDPDGAWKVVETPRAGSG